MASIVPLEKKSFKGLFFAPLFVCLHGPIPKHDFHHAMDFGLAPVGEFVQSLLCNRFPANLPPFKPMMIEQGRKEQKRFTVSCLRARPFTDSLGLSVCVTQLGELPFIPL